MKNFKYIIFLLLGVGIITSSCDDDFSEGDLLDQQAQLAAEMRALADSAAVDSRSAAVDALNQAGNLLDYTVTVTSDNQPLAGVSVTANNQAGASATITTDASGQAVFTDIMLGGHLISISSPDHLDVSYLVDFGKAEVGVHYEIIDGTIVPIEISEASKIELYSLTGLQTATVKGIAEIETDLTNNAPEIPQDITLRVNLDGTGFEGDHSRAENSSAAGDLIYVAGSFQFTEGDLGSAVVDNTTGAYSITVPATDEGTNIDIIYPLIEVDQTLAFSEVNGVDIGLQVGTQLTRFGTQFATAEATPTYASAIAEFPAPADPGRGFTLANLQPFNRTVFPAFTTVNELVEYTNDMKIRFNPGSGYQTTPVITMSAPDLAAGAASDFTVDMDWTFESVSFTNQGTGYVEGEAINVFVELYEGAVFVDAIFIGQVTAEADGTLPATLAQADMSDDDLTYSGTALVDNFEVVIAGGSGTGAVGEVSVNGLIDDFQATTTSSGYNSIPTFTVTGGSPTTPATIVIEEMAFAYTFDLDNSGVSQGYVVLPEISFEYQDQADGNTDDGSLIRLIQIDADGFEDAAVDNDLPLENHLIVSGGDLVYDEDAFFGAETVEKGITDFRSYNVPKVVVVEPEHMQTTADLTFNANGEVTGLNNIVVGTGYTSEYEVTITTLAGLPAAGAQIDLFNFTTTSGTGEVIWDGTGGDLSVVSGGSGYTDDVNITEVDFAGSTNLNVKNGQTYFNDINFGTGERVEDVQ